MLSKEIQLEVNKGAMLPLMEEFYTIQGEGFHTGTAAYFVRIGGCDVGVIGVMLRKLECRIASSVKHQSESNKKYSETVVVTGEPLMWDMTLLTQTLKKMDEKFILKPLSLSANRTWDWICLSKEK
jgi:organic radical activating enzyme